MSYASQLPPATTEFIDPTSLETIASPRDRAGDIFNGMFDDLVLRTATGALAAQSPVDRYVHPRDEQLPDYTTPLLKIREEVEAQMDAGSEQAQVDFENNRSYVRWIQAKVRSGEVDEDNATVFAQRITTGGVMSGAGFYNGLTRRSDADPKTRPDKQQRLKIIDDMDTEIGNYFPNKVGNKGWEYFVGVNVLKGLSNGAMPSKRLYIGIDGFSATPQVETIRTACDAIEAHGLIEDVNIKTTDSGYTRRDSVVVYIGDSVDNTRLADLVDTIHHNTPNGALQDESPLAANEIYPGLSVAAEPIEVGRIQKLFGTRRSSYNEFAGTMFNLALVTAGAELYASEEHPSTAALKERAAQIYSDFMLLSKIDSNTMLPIESESIKN